LQQVQVWALRVVGLVMEGLPMGVALVTVEPMQEEHKVKIAQLVALGAVAAAAEEDCLTWGTVREATFRRPLTSMLDVEAILMLFAHAGTSPASSPYAA